jgi:arylsulfatase A-like enzyme
LLEDGIDWLLGQMSTMPNPYLAYVHFLPPHAEYRPRVDFIDRFRDDGYQPMEKEIHPLANLWNQAHMLNSRRLYDEYVLYVDAEFERLFDTLEANGQLENTIFVLTSDHGEMFERGIYRHGQPTFHQPVIRVPLMIFEPGQNARRDIYEPTMALDILPTLLHLTGREIPSVLEGRVLPPYMPLEGRSIYAASWRPDKSNQRREKTTVMMVRGEYKVMV